MTTIERAQRRIELLRKQESTEPYEKVGDLGNFEQIAARAIAEADKNAIDLAAFREREAQRAKAQMRAERMRWVREQSHIPPVIVKKLHDPRTDLAAPAILQAIAMVQARKKIIGLLGPCCSGKTLTACFLLLQRKIELDDRVLQGTGDRDLYGRFITAPEITRIRYWELDKHWVMFDPFLVIDDIGRETDAGKTIVEEVVLKRYDRDIVTVFTSNLTAEEFSNAYDERVLSRIQRVGQLVELKRVYSK